VQQLMFLKPGEIEFREVAAPRLTDGEDALVRPLAVATCDLDALIIRDRTPYKAPLALGHEFVAEVVECGDRISQIHSGQLVVVPFQISCGRCARCMRGMTADCVAVQRRSMFGFGPSVGDWGGALSDLVRVPFADHMLVPVPDGVSPIAIASASDNIPDAWRTVAPWLKENPGACVLIVSGSPSLGLYAAAIALALGAGAVDFADTDKRRLELAASLGANPIEVQHWPNKFGEYPITVNSTKSNKALASAICSTEPGGVCFSNGVYFAPTPMPLFEMYAIGVAFHTGRVHARTVIPEVLALVRSGRFSPERITTSIVNWEDAPKAIRENTGKLVISRMGEVSRDRSD
jgi:threonine dehydrogenase-like Zn-dependent dehydrogenase